ncbi:MAG TPA: TAT-variant-translocated molybdopterin oxidoreductase [Gemmata sp.]|jgi:molybdopterin-containing oxidoreductase family iron-sulfur binding subunit|nr:TAT-variant-translocated molybdopterin oxidoreductase [Gemmata sp.]
MINQTEPPQPNDSELRSLTLPARQEPGKGYWRSLEDLADTPEFRAFAAKEFPGFTSIYEGLGEAEPKDDNPEQAALDRRKFLALSAAALGLAGLAGCRRPDLEILPFSAIPDDQIGHLTPGKPTFYATSLPRPGGAFPVLVESHDGRPTKVEGNPQHPASQGSTDVFAQATVLDLYSPDRVMSDKYPGVMEKKLPQRWDDFDRITRSLTDKLVKNGGEGFYILTDQVPSPALRVIREHIKTTLPKASWHTYEPVDTSEALKGAEIAFGTKMVAKYNFAAIARLLALDCDFLGCDPDQVANSRTFVKHGVIVGDRMILNRLYVVESTYTVTGTMADHRLRLAASQVGGYLIAVAKELKANHSGKLKKVSAIPANLPDPDTTCPEKWIKAVAKDLAEHAGKSIIIVGYRQPAWVHALAHAVNDSLGAYLPEEKDKNGKITKAALVEFTPAPPEVLEKGLGELTADMAAGEVNTLLIIGGNPVFNAPADIAFRKELQKVATKIRLGLFYDHTSEECDWHLPLCHALESWGDAEASDGTLCCVQPLIAPLNGGKTAGATDIEVPPRGGRTALEILALLTQLPNPDDSKAVGSFFAAQKAAYAIVRKVFSDRSGIPAADKTFDIEFNRYKQLGFLPADRDKGGRKSLPTVAIDSAKITAAINAASMSAAPTKDALEVTFHPDYSVYDGRFAMNPWLQELPDPITKLVWDNAAVISPLTANTFKLAQGDRVKLTVNGATLDIPVFLLPGQADFSIALAFGQFGEMRIAHVPNGGGFDVYPGRTSSALYTATNVKLEKTGRQADLVATQEHGVIPEGREIVVDLTYEQLDKKVHEQFLNGHTHTFPNKDGAHDQEIPMIGIPPDGHLTEEDFKKGFQGAYGNKQQLPAPVREKQERFPLDLARPELLDSQFQWGMVIDLSACTGCSACTIACQAENNIPVVGKTEVKRNREMHWIRVDRYFTTFTGGTTEDPQIVTQPVACVHCEQAPCEQVCPVNAAVHSPEGLNLQVYNRCIGTRYCSNACPYKVRRFNWFDFNKRRIDQLRVPTPFAEGGASLEHNLTPETLKMQKNPDVTVRMRGVMEKCTYCVQRLERGKYGAKIAAAEVAQGRRTIAIDGGFRAEGGTISAYKKPQNPKAAGYDLDKQGRVIVPDGLIVTACQSACPTKAITFGNTLDPHSQVSILKKIAAGEYLLLGELNTKPRTSYLPRFRNVNPEMA